MAPADLALLAGCQQFEAVMLRPLFEQLSLGRASFSEADDSADGGLTQPLGIGSSANDLMHSMFVDVLALALARAGGTGLAHELAAALGRARR